MASQLYVNVRRAIDRLKVKWKTVNIERIKELVRMCIVREINMIDERKKSRAY